MPSLLERKLYGDKDKIIERVESTTVNVTEREHEVSQELLSKISTAFHERISNEGFSREVVRDVELLVQKEVEKYTQLSYEEQQRVSKYVLANVTGLGPIQDYVDDPDVTEIVVQRYDNIVIERREGEYKEKSRRFRVPAEFTDENHLRIIIDRIIQKIGRQINFTHPMVDARLEDGSRVNATIPPMSPDGATLTIRKFSDRVMTGNDYIRMGSLTKDMLYFLLKSVEAKCAIIASGGTAAGKTSLLNLLSLAIPKDELIVTIEDPCELKLNQPNVRRLEANSSVTSVEGGIPITVSNCVKNCLRMAPDRIVVGEVRDGAIVDMLTAMSTGHDGSLSTIHANSPENLVNARLKELFAMSDSHFSDSVQQTIFREAVDMIVQIERMPDGTRKITHICEVGGEDENGRTQLHDIFVYDMRRNQFHPTGYIPYRILEKAERQNLKFNKAMFLTKSQARKERRQ